MRNCLCWRATKPFALRFILAKTDPIQERGFTVCRQWPLYLNVQVVDAAEDSSPVEVVHRLRNTSTEERSKLVEAAECEERIIPMVSKFSRVQAEVLAPGIPDQDKPVWVSALGSLRLGMCPGSATGWLGGPGPLSLPDFAPRTFFFTKGICFFWSMPATMRCRSSCIRICRSKRGWTRQNVRGEFEGRVEREA